MNPLLRALNYFTARRRVRQTHISMLCSSSTVFRATSVVLFNVAAVLLGGCEQRRTVNIELPDPVDSMAVSADSNSDSLANADPFGDPTRFTRGDSGGVVVVTSLDSLWRDDGWWIDTTDVILSVGVAIGDTTYELHSVSHAARLHSGGVALSEASEAGTWIKVFDENGRFRHRLGRRGQGLGEFTTISNIVALPGDSIFAYDRMERRITVFSPAGRLVRVTPIPSASAGAFSQVWPLANEKLVGTLIWMPGAPVGQFDPATLFVSRDTLLVFEIDTASASISRLLAVPNRNAAWGLAAGGDIIAGRSDRFELAAYDSAGSIRQIFRAPVLNVPLEPDSTLPQYRPRFESVLVDSEGNFWLKEPAGADRIVLDRNGRLLGTVNISGRREVKQIGSDWILMSRSDRLGVEYVEVLRIVKDRSE